MGTGAITGYVDVAQIVLYIFWVFFAGLIYYLVQEGKREGFPLESDRPDYKVIEGFPPIPKPKTFRLPHGGEFTAPHNRDQPQDLPARRVGNYPGSPIEPTGNPMMDGLGPAAWTNRADVPDQLIDGAAKIIPLRAAGGFGVASQDIDPRGLDVFGADGEVGGKIVDIWVDQAEMMFRYYEVEVPGGKRVLLPVNFSRVSNSGVKVKSILASQFAQVPTTRNPQQVTLLEEDKIMGYFGGGTLYATPERQEPLI